MRWNLLRYRAAWFAMALLNFATAGAQPAPSGRAEAAIPAEVFYRHPDIFEASLSPSGRWLAAITGKGEGRAALMTLDLDSKETTVLQAARFADSDIRSFHWVNDDRLVFDVVDFERGGGDQRTWRGLFSARRDGSEFRELISTIPERVVGAPNPTRIGSGKPLDWLHELLYVPIGGGDEVIIGEDKRDDRFDLTAIVVKRLDVTRGVVSPLSFGAPANALGWTFDPKGEPRVAETLKDGTGAFYWRAPGSDKWVALASFKQFEEPFEPNFVDASGALYVTTRDGPDSVRVLRRFDFATGRPAAEALVSTPGFDFNGNFVIDVDNGKILGVRVETDASTTVWFDPRMKAAQQAADSKLPARVNRLSCRRCGSADPVVLVHSWSDQDPGTYWVYWPKAERWRYIGPVRKDVDPKLMATLDFHRIKARDGSDLPVWITTPRGPAAAPRPAVVLVHGGPFVRGTHWRWESDAQFLASRGYLVIEPEFRGSAGYGMRHQKAGWKQWGRAMQDDVADAVQWATGKGWADPKRVCIAGASYGGYATLMGLVRHPELYRCGIAWAAVTDPRLMFEANWQSDLPDEWKGYGLRAILGDPVADAAMLASIAPVTQAARIKVPVLLAFGGQDRRVPIEHGERMRDALRAAGLQPQWVVYPEEGHGWLRVDNRIDFARRVEAFLAKQLQ